MVNLFSILNATMLLPWPRGTLPKHSLVVVLAGLTLVGSLGCFPQYLIDNCNLLSELLGEENLFFLLLNSKKVGTLCLIVILCLSFSFVR